jgi:uncharacterized protein (TIGR02996 family)
MKRVYVRGADRRELAPDADLPPALAKWRFDRACAALAARGYERVAGDEPTLPSHAELLAAIRASPDELDSYLVLSDWLADRGDPWGELIAVQHALATLAQGAPFERRRELERLEGKLRFVHAARLWGELGATVIDADRQRYACDLVDATWRCGFLHAIAIGGDGPHGRLLDAIAPLDIAAVLRTIELSSPVAWHDGALAALGRHAWPLVERIELRTDVAADAGGDVTAACFALADPTIAPRLRALSIIGARVGRDASDALAAAGFRMATRGGVQFTR